MHLELDSARNIILLQSQPPKLILKLHFSSLAPFVKFAERDMSLIKCKLTIMCNAFQNMAPALWKAALSWQIKEMTMV